MSCVASRISDMISKCIHQEYKGATGLPLSALVFIAVADPVVISLALNYVISSTSSGSPSHAFYIYGPYPGSMPLIELKVYWLLSNPLAKLQDRKLLGASPTKRQ